MTPRAGVIRAITPLALLSALGCSHSPGVRPSKPVAEPARPTAPAPVRDSVTALRDSLLRLARVEITGRENEPATQVFKNVQVLTDNVSAANLLRAMNFYGVALGVGCAHCHVVGQYAAEDSAKKAVAHQMMRMNGVINGQLLAAITGLKGPNPTVNCVTCHRGQVTPAKSLPPPR